MGIIYHFCKKLQVAIGSKEENGRLKRKRLDKYEADTRVCSLPVIAIHLFNFPYELQHGDSKVHIFHIEWFRHHIII